MSASSWEVELKFHVQDSQAIERNLRQVGFVEVEVQIHEDRYLRHPCRDFTKTDEAFRIRRVNDQAMVTYKGPRHAGPVKTREEIELAIDASQLDQWQLLVSRLGFQQVVPVLKTRRVFRCDTDQYAEIHVTLDEVQQLGSFAEIEIVVAQAEELPNAEKRVSQLAKLIGLEQSQPRSYLSLLLEKLSS